jgi:3-phosphoshikimate 1-carboxyvinyltransferase
MASIMVTPGRTAGTVAAPPSKSVAQRALLLAALSERPAVVRAATQSQDAAAMLQNLVALGAKVQPAADAVRFEPAPLRPPTRALDCGGSATTLRLLCATAARLPHPVTLDGDASLRARESRALLEALHVLGARVQSNDGKPPLSVHGPLHSGIVQLPPLASSQAASALALALPFLDGDSTVWVAPPVASRPYLDLTLAVAATAKLSIKARAQPDGGLELSIAGGQRCDLGAYSVEGDWSGAAFMLAAGAITQGEVTVTGLETESAQGDRAMVRHLRAFGCDVRVRGSQVTVAGPEHLASPGSIDVLDTPDLFPVLAVLAAAARGTTRITGGAALRGKESDRISAMAAGLGAMGVGCEELRDGLVVQGGQLQGASVASRGDHRIHMAFAVAGLAAHGPTLIDSLGCESKSYSAFHSDLRRLGATTRVLPEATA